MKVLCFKNIHLLGINMTTTASNQYIHISHLKGQPTDAIKRTLTVKKSKRTYTYTSTQSDKIAQAQPLNEIELSRQQ